MLDIFKLKHGESCQYVILRTTQSTTNHIFKGFKQYIKQRQLSSFYLSSQLQLERSVGQGEIGISIARTSQIITVFPCNIQAPDKILGVPEPKMFRMLWRMTQMQIREHGPHTPPPLSRDLKYININIYIYIYIIYIKSGS